MDELETEIGGTNFIKTPAHSNISNRFFMDGLAKVTSPNATLQKKIPNHSKKNSLALTNKSLA